MLHTFDSRQHFNVSHFVLLNYIGHIEWFEAVFEFSLHSQELNLLHE